MQSLGIEFAALFLYGPLLVLLHELGHALFAKTGGYRVTSFGVGLGKPLWSFKFNGNLVVHLDRWFLAGGACIAIPNGPPTRKRIWFHGGGLIVQGVLAVVLLLMPDHWMVDRIARFNLLVALTNLAPWRLGGSASDGWYILDALSGGRRTGNVLSQRSIFEAMSARELANGSPLGQAYADLCVAWTDVLAGRLEGAAEFFDEDPPETASHPWTDTLYHYVKAEWHRAMGRPLAALGTSRDGRATLHGAILSDALALLALAEGRALVALDEPDAARRVLQRVTDSPLAMQALPVLLWSCLDSETDDLELATWKVARNTGGPWLDPADPILALAEAAEELTRRGQLNAARSAAASATQLAQRALKAADIEDRRTLSYRLRKAVHSPVERATQEVRW